MTTRKGDGMDATMITMLGLTAAVAVLATKVISLGRRQRQVDQLIENAAVEKALDALQTNTGGMDTRARKHLHIAH